MSSPVTVQANKVWQLLTAPTTASAYRQAVDVTWTILRETAQLLWLVLCLVLVAGDWFWKQSIAAGRSTRDWVDNLNAEPTTTTDPGQKAAQVWQNLVAFSQTTSQSMIVKARQQLDLPSEPAVTASPAQPKPQPKPAVPAPPQAAEQPTAAESAKAAADAPEVSKN